MEKNVNNRKSVRQRRKNNKTQSKTAANSNVEYACFDIVWAKLRGYRFWPARVS